MKKERFFLEVLVAFIAIDETACFPEAIEESVAVRKEPSFIPQSWFVGATALEPRDWQCAVLRRCLAIKGESVSKVHNPIRANGFITPYEPSYTITINKFHATCGRLDPMCADTIIDPFERRASPWENLTIPRKIHGGRCGTIFRVHMLY